jgi:tight adherence protein B
MVSLLVPACFLGAAILLAAAFAEARGRRREIEQRLHLLGGTPPRAAGSGAPAGKRSTPAAILERLLIPGVSHPWELKTGLAPLSLWTSAGCGLSWLCLRQVFGFPITAAVLTAAATAFFIPRFILVQERRQIERDFIALLPDAIDTVARMLRAGLPVTSSFTTVGEEASPPVNTVFSALAGQMRIGIPMAEALRLASRQIGLPDFQFFAAAIVLQQTSGGNLASTLEMLSEIMRRRRAVRLKARAVTAEVRFSAYAIGSLPFFTTAALLVISPDYLTPLFDDPKGHFILGLAAGGLLLSAFTMRQMMRSVEQT